MNEYLEVIKKYWEFSGRAARKEYWMFTLVSVIVFLILFFIQLMVHFPYLVAIYDLASFLPSIGVSVRRLHDTNRSGWWTLIAFVPLIGWLVYLFFTVQDSSLGDNKFGPNPKGGKTPPAPII